MSVTTIEDFSSLIGNFDNTTSESTSTLRWKLLFSDSSYGISNGYGIVQNPNVFGNSISYDNGLKLFGSNRQVKYLGDYIYDIPGKTSIELISALNESYEFSVKINSFGPTTDQYMRTYDTIDNLESTYNNEEIFIGLGGVDGYEYGIVILKPPSRLKIKNMSRYVNEILKRGAIGDSTIFDIDDVCDDAMFTENQRILTTVYRKNGEYLVDNFDNGKPYEMYANNNGFFQYKYPASGNIKALNLVNIGTDGRKMKNINKSSLTNSHISSRIKNGELLNEFMYPSKANSTIIDIYDVTNNTPLLVSGKVIFQGDFWQSILWVSCGGVSYSTQRLFTKNTNILLPKISVVDYSTNYSISISSVTVEELVNSQDVGSIVSSIKKCIDPHIDLYVCPWPNGTVESDATISNAISLGIKVSGDAVIGINERVIYKINSYTPNSVLRFEYSKDGASAGGGGDYNVQFLSGILDGTSTIYGKYIISAYSEGSSITSEYEKSSNVVREFSVFRKAENPTCTTSLVTSNGGYSHINSYSFSQINNLPIYFTIDGSDVLGSESVAVAKYDITIGEYASGYFDTPCIIKYRAVDFSNGLISDQLEYSYVPATMTKLAPPVISYVNDVVTISSEHNSKIYYTIDGSVPSINKLKYESSFIASPIGNKLIIRAIAVMSGMISSDVSVFTHTYDYFCAPWYLEQGYSPIVSNNEIEMISPSMITRLGSFNEYSMDFDIISNNSPFDLIIAQRDSVLNINDYSNMLFNNITYYVGSTYSDALISRMHLGALCNAWDDTQYAKYATFTKMLLEHVHVRYEVRIIDNIYKHRLVIKIEKGEQYDTGWNYAGVDSISTPTIICNSPLTANSRVKLSNITLSCY